MVAYTGYARTPEPAARVLFERALLAFPDLPARPTVLEYGCGDGVLGRVIRDLLPGATLLGAEIEPLWRPFHGHYDAVHYGPFPASGARVDLVFGNPPWRFPGQATAEAMSRARRVAFLIPSNSFQGKKAATTLQGCGVVQIRACGRISFPARATRTGSERQGGASMHDVSVFCVDQEGDGWEVRQLTDPLPAESLEFTVPTQRLIDIVGARAWYRAPHEVRARLLNMGLGHMPPAMRGNPRFWRPEAVTVCRDWAERREA